MLFILLAKCLSDPVPIILMRATQSMHFDFSNHECDSFYLSDHWVKDNGFKFGIHEIFTLTNPGVKAFYTIIISTSKGNCILSRCWFSGEKRWKGDIWRYVRNERIPFHNTVISITFWGCVYLKSHYNYNNGLKF